MSALFQNDFTVRNHNQYLIFFDQIGFHEFQNKIYVADLTSCVEGNKFRIQDIYELPERD
jgi:hypothetical protein